MNQVVFETQLITRATLTTIMKVGTICIDEMKLWNMSCIARNLKGSL